MLFRDYRYVDGYPGYIVSNFGEIFSTKRGKVRQLKGTDRGKGYLCVDLYNNGKSNLIDIHALVGNAFIGVRTGSFSFDHIDRDRLNNRADNIRLATKFLQTQNRGICKNNKLGEQYIILVEVTGIKYYRLVIVRNKKKIVYSSYNINKYTLQDVAKIRDDVLAKYDHTVLLNKIHIELLKHIRFYTCHR